MPGNLYVHRVYYQPKSDEGFMGDKKFLQNVSDIKYVNQETAKSIKNIFYTKYKCVHILYPGNKGSKDCGKDKVATL